MFRLLVSKDLGARSHSKAKYKTRGSSRGKQGGGGGGGGDLGSHKEALPHRSKALVFALSINSHTTTRRNCFALQKRLNLGDG